MPAGIGNFPTLNGLDFGYSSVLMTVNSTATGAQLPFPLTGVKDFSYKDTLKPGEGRGTYSQITSTTTGLYSADGALTLYKSHFAAFWNGMAALAATQGIGPMQLRFDLTANYYEPSLGSVGLVTDIAHSCRITEVSDQHAEEDGVLVVKCNLHIIQIDRGGLGGQSIAPFGVGPQPLPGGPLYS